MPASASALTPARVAASEASMSPSQRRRAWMPATSPSTSVRMSRRSSVGFSRALISSEVNRRGASMWARPAMATCWNNMGYAAIKLGKRSANVAASGLRRTFRPVDPFTCRPRGSLSPGPESAAAAPGGPALGAANGFGQGVHGIGTQSGGLVAGQGFQLFPYPQRVAIDERDAVFHRHLDLPALLAARRRRGGDTHGRGAGR